MPLLEKLGENERARVNSELEKEELELREYESRTQFFREPNESKRWCLAGGGIRFSTMYNCYVLFCHGKLFFCFFFLPGGAGSGFLRQRL